MPPDDGAPGLLREEEDCTRGVDWGCVRLETARDMEVFPPLAVGVEVVERDAVAVDVIGVIGVRCSL